MTSVKRILLVDDDRPLRQSLAEQLQLQQEFETVEAGDGEGALAAVRAEPVAAVLINADLPDVDGSVLAHRLRDAGVRCPVILLAPAGRNADALMGGESAVNDVVIKPFRLGVLLARLRAQLRLFEQSENAALPIGPYTFRPAAKLLVHDASQERIRLTEKEAAILAFLYRAGDRVVARDMLLGEVWGYNAGVTTHTLETHVYRLRQKIERDPAHAEILVTDAGGYRLVP